MWAEPSDVVKQAREIQERCGSMLNSLAFTRMGSQVQVDETLSLIQVLARHVETLAVAVQRLELAHALAHFNAQRGKS